MQQKYNAKTPPEGQNSLPEKPCQKIRHFVSLTAILTIQKGGFDSEFQLVM